MRVRCVGWDKKHSTLNGRFPPPRRNILSSSLKPVCIPIPQGISLMFVDPTVPYPSPLALSQTTQAGVQRTPTLHTPVPIPFPKKHILHTPLGLNDICDAPEVFSLVLGLACYAFLVLSLLVLESFLVTAPSLFSFLPFFTFVFRCSSPSSTYSPPSFELRSHCTYLTLT